MPRITVDGTEYEVAEGRTLLQALDDLGVLGMAKAFEGLRGPQRPWPSPPKK